MYPTTVTNAMSKGGAGRMAASIRRLMASQSRSALGMPTTAAVPTAQSRAFSAAYSGGSDKNKSSTAQGESFAPGQKVDVTARTDARGGADPNKASLRGSEWPNVGTAVPRDPSGFAGAKGAKTEGPLNTDRIGAVMGSAGAAVREGLSAAGYEGAQGYRSAGTLGGATEYQGRGQEELHPRQDPLQFEFDRPDRSPAGVGDTGRSMSGFGLRDRDEPRPRTAMDIGDPTAADTGVPPIETDPLEQEFDRGVMDVPSEGVPQPSVGQPRQAAPQAKQSRPSQGQSQGQSQGPRMMFSTTTAARQASADTGQPGVGTGIQPGSSDPTGRALGGTFAGPMDKHIRESKGSSQPQGNGRPTFADRERRALEDLDSELRSSGWRGSSMADAWTGEQIAMKPAHEVPARADIMDQTQGQGQPVNTAPASAKEEVEGNILFHQGQAGQAGQAEDIGQGTARFGRDLGQEEYEEQKKAQPQPAGSFQVGGTGKMGPGRGLHTSSSLWASGKGRGPTDPRTLSSPASDHLGRVGTGGAIAEENTSGPMTEDSQAGGKAGAKRMAAKGRPGRDASGKDTENVVPTGAGQDDRADTYGRRAAESRGAAGQPSSASFFSQETRATPSPGMATAAGGKGRGFSGTDSPVPPSSEESDMSRPAWGDHPNAGAEHPTGSGLGRSGPGPMEGMDKGRTHSTNRPAPGRE